MIELWIDEEYKADVDASPHTAHHEPEHNCFRVILHVEDEMSWLGASWDVIAELHGFQPESVVYCH